MKKLSLRPYHGVIYLCKSHDEMRKIYKKNTKQECPHVLSDAGQYIKLEGDKPKDTIWLVYGSKKCYLAHEYSHILLKTFGTLGHDPTVGDGEPFCYMLSQLLLES
jgi:hypothetical protein